MVNRFTADLQPAEYLHRPAEKATCAAWTISHLALSDRGALKRMEVQDLPPLPAGAAKRVSRPCRRGSKNVSVATRAVRRRATLATFLRSCRSSTPTASD